MTRILIIDDQSTSRQILEELVTSLGERIVTDSFADPQAALTWARTNPPDLVLTDYKMPQMNGVEFTRRFRDLYPDVPLVMVTSVEDREIRYQALESGATDFLTKPVDHTECRARCRNLLTLRQQQLIIKDRARWLEEKVGKATQEIVTRERETLLRLAKAGEYRDEETGCHVLRMAQFSSLIAEHLGLSEEERHVIETAAPMHDIGKIGTPDNILLKPGKLDAEELVIMRTHARIGYEILKDSPSKYLQMGAVIARGHHEKFDGSGYPDGLAGEAIPLSARIVAVADVFDALTSERPYKHAWSIQDALQYLQAEQGRHFDPACVQAFLAQFDKVLKIRQQLQ
ncbi:MAG: divalent ion tolerance protein CutA, partial [Proteobacteria bacterium]|nr:divalent ion tolerance protein CutA [Pseudomonadota bacterium]